MKKIYPIHVFLFGILLLGVVSPLKAITYTWIGTVSSDWNTAANWSPAGVPDVADDVIIDATGGTFDPLWDELPGINNLTMSARTLNLNGFALQVNGTAVLSGGEISNGTLLITSTSATFSGTVFNVPVSYTGARCLFNGGVFNQPVTVVKNGGGNDASLGNCVFNSTLTVTNSDNNWFRFATVDPDIYNGVVTYTNTGAGGIYPAHTSSGNTYNANIVVNCTGAGGIRFCQGDGSATLAAGQQLSVGIGGFSSGSLIFRNFVQQGTAAHSISGTGSSFFTTEQGTEFNWNLTLSFPNFQIFRTTFNGDLTVNKSSNTQNIWNGGNTFQGTTRINNNGNNNLLMGNTEPDIFNGPLYLDNNTTGNFTISICRGSTGNQINNDVFLNNAASGGIYFGFNGGTTTLASGRTIQFFNDGITAGTITFSRFTKLGTAAINLSQTTGNAAITFLNGSEINGNLTLTFPRVFFNGSVFNGTVSVTKVGNSAVTSSGGNTFNGAVTFTNTTSGAITLGDVLPDIFNSTLSISNSGNCAFQVARTGSTNLFNGNITINSTGTSQGVRFGQNNGLSVLAAGALLNFGTMSAGTSIFRGFTQTSAEAITMNCTNNAAIQFESNVTLNGALTITASNVVFNGGTFSGNVVVNRYGSGASTSNGGATFNGDFTLNATGNGGIIYSNTTANTYNGNLTINNGQTSGNVSLSLIGANNIIGGNLVLTCSSTGGIGFGSGGGITTMTGSGTISLGAAGFTAGVLNLRGFVKQSTTAININQTTGNATLNFLPGSDIAGNVSIAFPRFTMSQTRFRNDLNVVKNGASGDNSPGGCTVDGAFTFSNTSSGQVILSNTSADIYNGNCTFSNSGNTILYVNHNGLNGQFNGNILLNSTGSSQGIRFGQGTGSATLANGRTIQVDAGGFSVGSLRFRRFVQAGTSAQTLTTTGTGTSVYFEGGTIFNGSLTVTTPSVFLNGGTFNANFTAICNSTAAFSSNGGNTFMGTTTLTHNGTNNWVMANVSPDVFQGNVVLRTTNSNGIIYLAHTATGNVFNGNIELNSTGTGGGVRFGNNNGTATLGSGFEMTIGAGGFSTGSLRIRRLTQLGSETQDLVLTGSAQLHLETGTVFNAAINFASPQLFVAGNTFNNIARLNQTGSTSVACAGGNTFNNLAFITLSGNNSWFWGNSAADVFQNELTLINFGNNVLYMAHNSSGHQFNGNVLVNSTSPSQGIRFCQGNGLATLGASATIQFGVTGFTTGSLRLRRITQAGTSAINLTSNVAAVSLFLESGNEFNGTFSADFHQVNLNGSTFNGTTTINQRGTTSVQSTGGNTFNGTTLITCTGSGEFRLAGTNPDQYNGSVTFRNTTAGRLMPAFASEARFAGNVTTSGSTSAVSFSPGSGNGRVVFNGTGAQSFGGTVALPPTLRNVTLNKTSGTVTLNSNVTVTTNISFSSGTLTSGGSQLLILNDNCTATGMSNSSYIIGPVRKIGNDAFTFPVGRGGFYRPISISAPGNTAHHFTAEYFNASSNSLYPHSSKVASINILSTSEYWILNRTNGTSNVVVSLSWGANSGGVNNPATLQVCRWDGSTWRDHGNGGINGSFVSSSGAVTSFSPFTLGSQNNQNPLPITLLNFNAEAQNKTTLVEWSTASEINNHYFEVQRSADLLEFETISRIQGAGNSNSMLSYTYTDEAPLKGMSYYRLVQTDFDGTRTEFAPVPVMHANNASGVVAFPNPFHSSFELRLSEQLQSESLQIRIVDIQGRIIQQFTQLPNAPVSSIQLGDALPGLYFVEIQSAKGAEVIRLIKQ